MGYAKPRIWADVRFRAAYLLATRDVGEDAASARLDWFDARSRDAIPAKAGVLWGPMDRAICGA
jgi:hypothetical protein